MNNKLLNRVKAGIAYLNVVQPNWVKKINLRKFNLEQTKTCVIGSVFEDYFMGLDQINLSEEASENMGFSDQGAFSPAWKKLEKIWIKEITKLKRKSARKINK